jgi:hypothetical protein
MFPSTVALWEEKPQKTLKQITQTIKLVTKLLFLAMPNLLFGYFQGITRYTFGLTEASRFVGIVPGVWGYHYNRSRQGGKIVVIFFSKG